MSRRGQLLMIVLWVMGVLTVALGGLAMHSTHESRLSRIPLDLVDREALLQSAVFQAMAVLAVDDPSVDHLEEPWASGHLPDGTTWSEQITLEQGACSIGEWREGVWHPGLVDESSKLNLRTASPAQVHALFTRLVPADANPAALAAALQDWQNEPVGETCQAVLCHNAPLETVDELLAVPGMTPQLVETLRPYVTVYGSGQVNVNTASALVLDALGCPSGTLIQERAQEPFTAAPPSCPGAGVASTAFLATATGELAHRSGQATLHAIVTRTGEILSWEKSGTGTN